MLRLVRPTVRYKTTFCGALKEMARENGYYAGQLKEARKDFPEYVRRQRGKARGKFLQQGYVPESKFWLVDGSKLVGLTSIRHRLTKFLKTFGGHIGYVIRPSARRKGYGVRILRLTLSRAGRLGLKRVLVTCSPRNIASRKIIESNGGIFWDRTKSKQIVCVKYWISLK